MKAISIPFKFSSSGKVAITEDSSVIVKQKIIDALVTNKYERVNNPDYGIAIRSLLFSPLDPLIFTDFKVDALSDLTDYISNAKVLDIQFIPSEYSDSSLLVRVSYRTNDGTVSTLVANINPNTILTEESTI